MAKKFLPFVFSLSLLFVLAACQSQSIFSLDNSHPDVAVSPSVPAGEVAVIKGNVVINQPVSNDVVFSPLVINGRTAVADQETLFRLRDASDQIIGQGAATVLTGVSGQGVFSATLEFNLPSSPTGFLEVYNQDINGGVQNLVKIPIQFKESKKPVVTVYFGNSQKNPGQIDCAEVYPVEREVEYSPQLIFRAIDQLLAGPTAAEKQAGYFSTLPTDGIKAQKVEIKDGKVYVDFNQALQAGVGGSCRVTAIRSQIMETLKLFSDTDEVVISIDGETEAILQP